MKKLLLLFMAINFIVMTNIAYGQESISIGKTKSNPTINPNFKKGKVQIAVEGLNFSFGYGRVIGGVGFRTGYFVANNSLIFLNGEYSTYGEGFQQYKMGLNIRQYFNTKTINPYVQLGANMGWENFYNDRNKNIYEITVGSGVTFNVGKFGFDLGMQINVWDKVNLSPRVGVSYSF